MARRFPRVVIAGAVAALAISPVFIYVGIAAIAPGVAVVRTGSQANECPVRARSFPEIRKLIESPPSIREDPVRLEPEMGATSETIAEIESLVVAFIDCSAAGEPLRVWSLYSDAYLGRLLERERGYDQVRYCADLVAAPLDLDERPELRVVSQIVTYGEDHASATAVIWYPNLRREKALAWWFVRVGDVWRIDEIDGEITFAAP